MDDPLVPKSVSGCTRLAVQITCALAVIFIFVAVLLIFIEGGKTGSGGWVVVGIGFLLILGSTGVIVRWVMKNELEESKHMYLLVSQALALIVLSAGFLAVIYAAETPTYYIGGAAGPVIMETGVTPARGTSLQLVLNNNQSNIISIGTSSCQSFLFATRIPKDEKYSVTFKSQPSGALCTMFASGIASKNLLGNDAIRVNCLAAWLIGGNVFLSGGGVWGPGLVLSNNGQEQINVQSDTAGWYFPTPILNNTRYAVAVMQSPAGLACTIPDKAGGLATAPLTDIQVQCKGTPTPAPPTKQ